MTMTEIDRAYVLRLYAVHERCMDATHDLQVVLLKRAENGWPVAPDVGRCANDLDFLTDQAEKIFAEVLTDQERNIPSDEEFAAMVNELVGRE